METSAILAEFAQEWSKVHPTIQQAIAARAMRSSASSASSTLREVEELSSAGLGRLADLEAAAYRAEMLLVDFFRRLTLEASNEMDKSNPEIRAAWQGHG